eukprot:CAMPEP_0168334494 /NCGR_PEP_ID=MMETSP0213-20121227/10303_1 /TAXON_ID=151035 /ORGANISM="Euplotes harpa, Strain FSP1.4" /LENGTH=143 /DNA_ID=CAMNT_0008339153 /DNA_START=6 /DNA_END=437 /DNA_ORIENTATION=-
MKFIAVVLIAILLSSAYSAQLLTKGSDLKKYLEGTKDGTFIILFFDREAPQLRTEDMRNQIRSKILKANPAFNYFEVDIKEQEYNPIVDGMMKLDREEIKHSPTILVASEGRGYWAHGEKAVDDVTFHLNEYSVDKVREARKQ